MRWRRSSAWWRVSRVCPRTPLIYYSRDTGPDHWRALEPLTCSAWAWTGVASGRHAPLADAALVPAGNLDPQWLLLPAAELEVRVRAVFASVGALPAAARAAWVCGWSRVLPQTPESNVHLVLKIQREMFA